MKSIPKSGPWVRGMNAASFPMMYPGVVCPASRTPRLTASWISKGGTTAPAGDTSILSRPPEVLSIVATSSLAASSGKIAERPGGLHLPPDRRLGGSGRRRGPASEEAAEDNHRDEEAGGDAGAGRIPGAFSSGHLHVLGAARSESKERDGTSCGILGGRPPGVKTPRSFLTGSRFDSSVGALAGTSSGARRHRRGTDLSCPAARGASRQTPCPRSPRPRSQGVVPVSTLLKMSEGPAAHARGGRAARRPGCSSSWRR